MSVSCGSTCANIRAAAAADGRVDGSRRSSAAMSGASFAGVRRDGRVLVDDRGHRGDRAAALLVRPASLDRRVDAWRRATTGRSAGVASPPRMRSGAVNPGEPITMPVWVSRGSPSNCAMPKSVSTARSSQPSPILLVAMSTLLGFTSRCSTPAVCAAASADSSCWPIRQARAAESRPSHGQHLVERLRRDELHHDPGTAVFLGDVVDGDDAAVRQPRGGPRLAQRPLVGVAPLVRADQGRDDDLLDRDVTVKELVARTPHHAHGTTADGVLQVVSPGDDPSCHRGHSRTISAIRGGCRLTAAGRPPRRRNRCPCRRR